MSSRMSAGYRSEKLARGAVSELQGRLPNYKGPRTSVPATVLVHGMPQGSRWRGHLGIAQFTFDDDEDPTGSRVAHLIHQTTAGARSGDLAED